MTNLRTWDIMILDDGVVIPFYIQSSRDTRFSVIAETRDAVDEKDAADGDIDFGTWLGMGGFKLHGIIECDTLEARNVAGNILRRQLNDCRSPKTITYEHTPDKFTAIQLTDRPEIVRFPNHLEVRAEFKAYPFWLGTVERSIVGSGVIENEGTFETGLLIEVAGPVTDPSLTIGGQELQYTGTVGDGEVLFVDTEREIVRIGNVNVIGDYNGVFPLLYPGKMPVTVPGNVTVTIRWRDKWI